MKKLRLSLIIFGCIITLNPCFASSAKPTTSDEMEVEKGKDAKPSIQVQETKQAQTSDDEQLAALFDKTLTLADDANIEKAYEKTPKNANAKFIDNVLLYHACKTKLLFSNKYDFNDDSFVYVISLPSVADCAIMHFFIKTIYGYTLAPDGITQPNASAKKRYGVRMKILKSTTIPTISLLKTYRKIFQILTTGWVKNSQTTMGYTSWIKKQTLNDEDSLIFKLATLIGFSAELLQCTANNGIIRLSIVNDVLPLFESSFWPLPK